MTCTSFALQTIYVSLNVFYVLRNKTSSTQNKANLLSSPDSCNQYSYTSVNEGYEPYEAQITEMSQLSDTVSQWTRVVGLK